MRLQFVVCQSVALTPPGEQIRDEHIATWDHPVNYFAGLRLLEVERDAALAAVVQLERVVIGDCGACGPRDVTAIDIAGRRLDLDDVRAGVGQERAASRRRQPVGDFEDPDAGERAFRRASAARS